MRHALLSVLLLSAAACDPVDGTEESVLVEDVGSDDLPREYRILTLEPDVELGEVLYMEQCFGCHRPNGIDGLGPSLPAYVADSPPLSVVEIMIYGEGRMTAIGARMPDQDIADLVGYLYDEWGS